jgi:hypothetical protein
MAAISNLPQLAVLIFVLLVASAIPSIAGSKYSGARMVIIRSPATTRVVGAAGARSNEWQQHYRQLVEDEVTPELGGLLGAGMIGYGALYSSRPACPQESGNQNQGCTTKSPGQPYVRGCSYMSQCPHTPVGVAN